MGVPAAAGIGRPGALRPGLAALIIIATALPVLARWWEAGMVRHMLGQIPLLVLAGILLAPRRGRGGGTPDQRMGPDQHMGIAAVLAAGFCLAFWMLPRWFDAAVGDGATDAAKMATLVLLAGLPLGWGWPRLRMVARGFVWAHLIGMLAVMGMLYLGFPDRLCNNYLESEQVRLGQAMLVIAGALSAWIAATVLFGAPPPAAQSQGK